MIKFNIDYDWYFAIAKMDTELWKACTNCIRLNEKVFKTKDYFYETTEEYFTLLKLSYPELIKEVIK